MTMSKRFGRNQKRKLRAELEQAKRENDRLDALLDMERIEANLLRYSNNKLRHAVELTRDVLGNYFCSLQDATIDLPYPGSMVAIPHHERGLRDYDVDSIVRETSFAVQYIDLVLPSLHKDKLRQATTVRVTHKDKGYAYAISDASIALLPRDEVARRISIELAEYVARALKETMNDGAPARHAVRR